MTVSAFGRQAEACRGASATGTAMRRTRSRSSGVTNERPVTPSGAPWPSSARSRRALRVERFGNEAADRLAAAPAGLDDARPRAAGRDAS